jgi:hypothetical protein
MKLVLQKQDAFEQFFLYLRHNKLKKAYLDRAFGESRSGMIAHKTKNELRRQPMARKK